MDHADPTPSREPRASTTLGALESLLSRAGCVLDTAPEELGHAAPDVSAWNRAEQLFHLVLACDLSFRNVAALVARRGRLIRDPIERHGEGLAYLAKGALPRGRVEAPRFVRPPKRIDFALLRELHGEVCEARTELAADPAAVDGAPRAIPHQLLGDLSAAEWLRFAEVHSAHHLAIIEEIGAALGAS